MKFVENIERFDQQTSPVGAAIGDGEDVGGISGVNAAVEPQRGVDHDAFGRQRRIERQIDQLTILDPLFAIVAVEYEGGNGLHEIIHLQRHENLLNLISRGYAAVDRRGNVGPLLFSFLLVRWSTGTGAGRPRTVSQQAWQ
ncbi:hypothetical protein [Devosia sp.]|uniref:hypothetical protein n=1 Tax=Devosia sp. TaxID=1871048 RepID=UPI0025C6F706|nr:hypothetical protein [Devosia sp.]